MHEREEDENVLTPVSSHATVLIGHEEEKDGDL